jgi:hypothetical protein
VPALALLLLPSPRNVRVECVQPPPLWVRCPMWFPELASNEMALAPVSAKLLRPRPHCVYPALLVRKLRMSAPKKEEQEHYGRSAT